MSSVFGRSMSFPPRVGADGRFVWSAGEENIRESIAVILKSEPGERVGILAKGSEEFFILWLGCAKARACLTPVAEGMTVERRGRP